MAGFIKIHRQITEWEWYTDIPVRVLFEHCLFKANFEDRKWHGVIVKRGSFITSYENLAYETGLTIRQTRTALNKLKSTGELTHQTTSQYSVITVNNYEKYQTSDKQIDKQATSERQASDKQATTTKEYKEIKNDKNIILSEKVEKKPDPFINPIKTYFTEEYTKIMGKTPRLSFIECQRLIELASENSDIREIIPEAIRKLKVLKFDNIKFTPSASWLLKGNNFERLLNGEFEEPESEYERLRRKFGGSQ